MLAHLFDSGVILRLLYATCAGLILGFPHRREPGGIRAHVLVTLGAAYFSTTAVHVAGEETVDVIRVIQGVTSGIGFVGAASVLKKGGSIHGVSTAASIWIAAAVGCDAGLGTGGMVLVTAPVITLLSVVVGRLESHYFRKHRRIIRSRRRARRGEAS